MARRVRYLYDWHGRPEEGSLERVGSISEARLRAWEYSEETTRRWVYTAGSFRDTVHPWHTARPDLRIAETLFVGEVEEAE